MSFSAARLSSRRGLSTRRIAIALAVVALTLTGLLPSTESVQAGSRYSKSSRTIRQGLTLMSVVDSQGPNRIKVLKLNPATNLTLDVALANNRLPGRERTSSMARRRGAIAAVNGNFGTDWGRPLGLFAEDGRLQTSPIASGGAFALSKDERRAYVGYPDLEIVANNLTSDVRWNVSDWNDQYPADNGIAAYTKSGGDAVRPPSGSCSVRLLPQSKMRWGTAKIGVGRTYDVDKVACGERLYPLNGVVLAADRGTNNASRLSAARRGQDVRLAWSLGWAGVMDAIGGSPVLMRDGRVTVDACSGYVCQRHPRTGVGVTPKGHILLVTVDGRRDASVGMSITEFARLFQWLGAESAMNLDGGGSSTMVVRGRVVNSPSDSGGEREVVSSLVVLPGADKGEPRPLAP
jgi:hypothetical protein